MLTAAGSVETERASRYLVQLCAHIQQISGHHVHRPGGHRGTRPEIETVEWSDTDGVITFDLGQCTLRATANALTLIAEAADPDSLQQIKDVLSVRLQTIGRRDHVIVIW